MALGNNMRKTFTCRDSLKLKSNESFSNGSTEKATHTFVKRNNETKKCCNPGSNIIEARLLSGTLFL